MKPAERSERIRRAAHAQRMADIARWPTPRMKARAAVREACVDQITLDKLNGLESGKLCRAAYREERRSAKPAPVQRSKRAHAEWPGPRPADTYRGARRKAQRGKCKALIFKAARLRMGITRRQADRLNWELRKATQ